MMNENKGLASQKVLDDARAAFDMLEACEDDDRWRVYFVSCLALLRAVGHVLDKVDGEASPEYRRAVDKWWTSVKAEKDQNGIFWFFVEAFRNNILKTYEFGAEPLTYGIVFSQSLDLPGGNVEPGVYWSDGIIIRDGAYSGHDARDLILDAILWWERQLIVLRQNLQNPVGGEVHQ